MSSIWSFVGLGAIPLVVLSCAGPTSDVVGFGDYSDLSEAGAAHETLYEIRECERHIDLYGRIEPASAPPATDAELFAEELCRAAYDELLAAYLRIGSHELRVSDQERDLGSPAPSAPEPFGLYPRLVTPHLSEGLPLGGETWHLAPVLLNRRAHTRNRRVDEMVGVALASFVLSSPSFRDAITFGRVRGETAFYLRSRTDGMHRRLPVETQGSIRHRRETDRPLDEPFLLRLTSARFGKGHLPDLREDAWGLVLVVPPGFELPPQLLDLIPVPRFWMTYLPSTEPNRRIRSALAQGDWEVVIRCLPDVARDAEALGELRTRLYPEILDHLNGHTAPAWATHWVDWVQSWAPVLADSALLEAREPALRKQLQELLTRPESLMPVSIAPAPDPSAPEHTAQGCTGHGRCFSFVVGADVQYHGNMEPFARFLATVDPHYRGLWTGRTGGKNTPMLTSLPAPLSEALENAAFIVLNGDLGDGEGVGTSAVAVLLNALGLAPPSSPYYDPDDCSGEFPELGKQLRLCSKPTFAVPGNHDGYTNFGGLSNQIIALLAQTLRYLPIAGIAGNWLRDANGNLVPTAVRTGLRFGPTSPFSDGLIEWTSVLGLREFGFHYRGQAFVGINSFQLDRFDRDGIGAVQFNWGGGTVRRQRVWLSTVLPFLLREHSDATARDALAFAFMHHDPRGATVFKSRLEEVNSGRYDTVNTPGNQLTFGLFGLSWSPDTPLYIPLLTPASATFGRMIAYGEGFQQQWMLEYEPKETIAAINRHVPPPPDRDGGQEIREPRAGLAQIFFAHDDAPVVSRWTDEQGNPFDHPRTTRSLPARIASSPPVSLLFKHQTDGPPEWSSEVVAPGGDQVEVIRVDDIDGQDHSHHGFTLVTVHFERTPNDRAGGEFWRVEPVAHWIPLGR